MIPPNTPIACLLFLTGLVTVLGSPILSLNDPSRGGLESRGAAKTVVLGFIHFHKDNPAVPKLQAEIGEHSSATSQLSETVTETSAFTTVYRTSFKLDPAEYPVVGKVYTMEPDKIAKADKHEVPSAEFKDPFTISDFHQYIDKHKPHPAPTLNSIILADNKAQAMSQSMSFSPEMIKSNTYGLSMEIFHGEAYVKRRAAKPANWDRYEVQQS